MNFLVENSDKEVVMSSITENDIHNFIHAFEFLVKKLDADGGRCDTDYESSVFSFIESRLKTQKALECEPEIKSPKRRIVENKFIKELEALK